MKLFDFVADFSAADRRPQTADRRPQTADRLGRRPQTVWAAERRTH